MGVFSAGLFLGFLSGTFVKYAPQSRFRVFILCSYVCFVCLTAFPLVASYPLMLALCLVAGVANAILNSFIGATVGLAVPQDMRGKVFALVGTLAGGLTPIAMALAGGLAEFIPIRPLVAASFGFTLVAFVPLMFIKRFRHFVNFDPEKESVESLLS